MSRILILGGGSSQLALIRRCRELGHHVIVADIDPGCPGRELADDFATASTFDPDGVTGAAEHHRVDGIITMGSDQPVLTQATAAARLGLPSFLPPEQALLATNKRYMKLRLREEGVPLAPFVLLSEDDRRIPSDIGLPAVIKPLDSQGQRGIFYRTERRLPAEMIAETLSFSQQHEFIAEEFYPGGEVTLSGWMHRGNLIVYTVTDRVTRHLLPRLGVCFAHRYPSRYRQSSGTKIIDCCRQAVRALGFTSGPVYIQLFVGQQGVVLNEVACRLGGAYEDEFLPLLTGVATVDLLIRGSLGEELSEKEIKPSLNRELFISVPLIFCKPGFLAAWRSFDEAASLPGVRNLKLLLPPGTEIHPTENSTQRAAYAVITGASPNEVNESVEHLFNTLKALGPQGEELLIDSRGECRFPDSE